MVGPAFCAFSTKLFNSCSRLIIVLVLINFQTLEHDILACCKAGLVNPRGCYRDPKSICGDCIPVWLKVPPEKVGRLRRHISVCPFASVSLWARQRRAMTHPRSLQVSATDAVSVNRETCFREPMQPHTDTHLCFCFFSVALLRCRASTVAFLTPSFSNIEISHFIAANCQTPSSNYQMYFHVFAKVSRRACFPLQSCDVSEDLVCLQLSALEEFVLISFGWHIHTPCACLSVKQPEPALFCGSSSPVQDIFVLCVGERCADVRQIGGCRRRVRIKEDVATSSKPHETVLSFLLIFHLNLKKKKKRKCSSDIRSVDTSFIVLPQPGCVCICWCDLLFL